MPQQDKAVKPLKWKTRFSTSFENEQNFLEVILKSYGVEDIRKFLYPRKEDRYDPFLFSNMDKAVELFNEYVKMDNPKIGIKVDCDTDGYTSSTLAEKFIKKVIPNAEVERFYSYNKEHGLTYKLMSEYVNDYFDLIIIPDASWDSEKDYELARKNSPKTKYLILDHHAVDLLNTDYCININCQDGQYPNNTLSGVGVVMKFCEAYCKKYNIDDSFLDDYLDLVATGISCDGMSLKNPETRYYVTEGMKKENLKNNFLNELQARKEDEFAFGRTILNTTWNIGPLVNGVVRYGKKSEIENMFRAMVGEEQEVEYQPRRKSVKDPKPPIEYHTLQWDMARVAVNVKQRQDNAVRDYMKSIEEKIEKEGLDKDSVLFIDCDDIVDKKTVSGLCANKIASKYTRPAVLLKSKSSTEYGGSGRNYAQGNIENFNEFLNESGLIECAGHNSAFGISMKKEDLQKLVKYCNEKNPLKNMESIIPVSWEISAKELRKEYIEEVANAYQIWGNDIEQPMFAITNLEINASNIQGFGENNNFIRFVYNNIPFIKKYCPHGDYENMTMKTRTTFGINKKNLVLNIIGQFVLNSWEDKVTPQVKILYYDVKENKNDVIDKVVKQTVQKVKEKDEKNKTNQTEKQKVQRNLDEDDDDFVF